MKVVHRNWKEKIILGSVDDDTRVDHGEIQSFHGHGLEDKLDWMVHNALAPIICMHPISWIITRTWTLSFTKE